MAAYPSFPDLSRAPELKGKESTVDPTLRSDMENGMEISRARFTRWRRQLTVSYKLLVPDDKRLLDDFMVNTAVYGAKIFLFADPHTDPANPKTYSVRFSQLPSWGDLEYVGADGDWPGGLCQTCSFELREV